jgi:aminoglycoside phosphotransferase (APT) family kinase protein
MPAAEVSVDDSLVRALLADQHSDLAALPVVEIAHGWDNAIYRLGDHLTVRLPRRAVAAALLENEQRWLPELAPRLPIPIPTPVRVGTPGRGYPWGWSVCPYLPGRMAADVTLTDPVGQAERLGEFVVALHRPAPSDAPDNVALRGHPLAELTERLEMHLGRGVVSDADAVRGRWAELSTADAWQHRPVWLHGDLHTANVLVDHGAISAVIDFGDITAGDPAVDLAIAWMLFDEGARAVFRSRVEADDARWARAEAWALYFAVIYLANSADNARVRRMGGALLAAVLDG